MRQESLHCVVASMRSKRAGPFGPDETAVLAQLIPHLQRAVQFQRRMSGIELMSKAALNVLDRLPQAILLVDSKGVVLFLNRAAQAIISQLDGLSIQRKTLCAARTDDTRALRKLIQDASAIRFDEAQTAGSIAISRPSLKRSFLAFVTPIPAMCVMDGIERPSAAVFVADPESIAEPSSDILSRLYGFTKAESRLASLLTSGKSIQDCCDELSVTRNTARTQLKRLFEKANVRRQSELVSVLMRSTAVHVAKPRV